MAQFSKIVLFLLLSFASIELEAQCNPANDSLQLVKLYNNTNGNNWYRKWDLTKPMSSWNGVKLTADGCVKSLRLANNNLKGSLVALDLPSLEDVDLQFNELTGLVTQFPKSTKLFQINLANNDYSGTMHSFNENTGLRFLFLNDNNISEALPTFGNLVNLSTLDLSRNDLSGPIPDYRHLERITILRLSDNRLSDNMPNLDGLTNLRVFDISKNKLEGQIPKLIGSAILESYDISHNRFKDNLPDWPRFNELTFLDVSYNQISGGLQNIQQFPKLATLNLSQNKFGGNFSYFTQLPSLEELNITSNLFTGNFPSMTSTKLKKVYAANNQFGPELLPQENCPKLSVLNLSGNQLMKIATSTVLQQFVDSLNLSNNRLTFEDFEVWTELPVGLTYSDQQKIELADTIYASKGENVEIRSGLNEQIGTEFVWYKNNVPLLETQESYLFISNVRKKDEGFYYGVCTNSRYPALRLITEKTELVIDCPVVRDTVALGICPGSYVLYKNDTLRTITQFNDTIVSTDLVACDSIIHVKTFTPDLTPNDKKDVICKGKTYPFGDNILEQEGNYLDTLTSSWGCDSIVNLSLTLADTFFMAKKHQICVLDSFQFGDQMLRSSGLYFDSLQTIVGCDSIIALDLIVLSTLRSKEELFACPGDSIYFQDSLILGGSFSQTDTLKAVGGCDSIAIFSVQFGTPSDTTFLKEKLCEGSAYTIGDSSFVSNGQYKLNLINSTMCDSVIIADLSFHPSFAIDTSITICSQDSFFYQGKYLSSSGMYTDSLKTVVGCDSIINLSLQVVDTIYDVTTAHICPGDSILFEGQYYKTPGWYVSSDSTFQTCDTLKALQLTVSEITIDSLGIIGSLEDENDGEIAIKVSGSYPPFSISWSNGITGVDTLRDIGPGVYTVTVSDSMSCVGTMTYEIETLTSIQRDWFKDITVKIAPNPSNHNEPMVLSYQDKSTSKHQYTISIFDVFGKEVSKTYFVRRGSWTHVLNTINAPGLYYARLIRDGQDHLSLKLIIQ